MADPDAPSRDRMSDFEALMWEVERSPMLSNAFANLTLLDRPPDRERFVARMRLAVERVPRLHQRAVAAPGRLATPEWLDDPEFDLDHHLRWVSFGGNATREDLYDLVATFIRSPFDRGRPVWEFIVIEGLERGRAAMLQRMHHTITDGEGGIKLSVEFLDFERRPDDPAGTPSHGPPSDTLDADASPDPTSPEEASTITEAARALADTVRHRGSQLVGALGTVGSMARHPGDAAAMARSAARQAMVPGRCSPLWTERSLQRWFGTTELALEEVKAAAHVLGGSVNDFFVCGAAAGAGAYHLARGAEVDHLRLSMPVSSRPARHRGEAARGAGGDAERSIGGNAFAPTQSLVPTAPMEPAERFRKVHEVLDATKSEPALGVIDSAAAVVNLLPSAALVAAGQRLTAGVDFVCSNVRAAPFDVYIAGALLEANYPIGPLAGTAFNLTTMSYRGSLFLGLVVDPIAVEEPDALLRDIEAAYTELFDAAGATASVG
jgi:WS/DGAT/MGAT family acyltransferase